MQRTETDRAQPGAGPPQRQPYSPPSLTIYGSVGFLTQNLMIGGKVDGGNPGMPKTA